MKSRILQAVLLLVVFAIGALFFLNMRSSDTPAETSQTVDLTP